MNVCIYRRSGPPNHSLLVMNRLNTDNLIEPVTTGLELQLQEPFLLYRNAHRRIFGLWFYDRDECARIAAKIESLVRESEPDSDPKPHHPPPQKTEATVDIFTMLSKAQNDYNSKSKSTPLQTPRAPDIASQSVMDFFAKAGGTAQPSNTNLFGVSCPPIADEGPMLLQRLMSNPVHSVEHIEKQQRSVTPKGDPPSQKKQDSKRKNKPDTPKTQSQKTVSKPNTNGQTLENELNFMSISTPKPSSPPTIFPKQLRQRPQAVEPPEESISDTRPLSAPLSAVQETPQKPALMPPTMFTSSAAKTNSERPILDTVITPIKPSPTVDVRPEPLTRNQLLQALNYLIKNDAEFMTKLHEAYVKSFSELVS